MIMIVSLFFTGLIGPALIGAGSSIVNGIGNLFGTISANKKNLQIARETNQANKDINQSQLDYNWQMWHAQNEYNNPAAQRQRLVDAGLNPIYYGLDGNSAGAGNAFSPVAAQQASPMIPNNFDAFGQAGQSLLQAAQIRNLEADTDKKGGESVLAKEKAETERELRSGLVTIQGLEIKLKEGTLPHDISKAAEDVNLIKQNVRESENRVMLLRSQTDYQNFKKALDFALYRLEYAYKHGQLDLQERNLVRSWFDSYTERQNASTNYFNVLSQAQDRANTQGSRISQNWSAVHVNNALSGKYKFEVNSGKKAFRLEQLNRAATYYKTLTDSWWYRVQPFGNTVGRSIQHNVLNSVPDNHDNWSY